MATLNRETIEQEIGKRFEKIEKTLERTLENALAKALAKAQEIAQTPAGTRAQAAAERASEKIVSARESAKKSLDDVLLGLEHKGYNVKEPQDLIQTVGRRVLERASEIAEDVRSQVAAKPYSPEWLKNVTIPRPAAATPAPLKATAMKVEAGATEADGELAESAEDSMEEKSAGTVVHSEPDVVTTSLAEATESMNTADFQTAGKVALKSAKKSSKVSKTKK